MNRCFDTKDVPVGFWMCSPHVDISDVNLYLDFIILFSYCYYSKTPASPPVPGPLQLCSPHYHTLLSWFLFYLLLV